VDDLSLKCHLISVVRSLDKPKIGKRLKDRLVVGVSLTGEIQFCNPAFEKLANQQMGELVGTSFFAQADDDIDRIKEHLAIAFDTGVSIDTGLFSGNNKIKWKIDLISPGDAYLLCSGEILSRANSVIGFPMKQSSA